MAGFGFNTDVHVGDVIYHVQTEPCHRPATTIETSVFQAGRVQYVRRVEGVAKGALAEQIRAQHGAVIGELRRGALRGLGPALELRWTNAEAAHAAAGALHVAVEAFCGAQPAADCAIRATLTREGHAGAPLAAAGAQTDAQGLAALRLALPAAAGAGALCLTLEAECGLSLACRRFRLS